MFKQYHKYKLALIIADFWITMIMLWVTEYFRPFLPGQQVEYPFIIPHYSLYFFTPFLFHVLFALTGVYNYKRMPNLSMQITRLTFSYSLGVWVFAGLLFFTFRDTSRLLVIYFSAINFIALVAVRYIFWRLLNRKHPRTDGTRLLIVGSGNNATLLARSISEELGSVFKLVGFVHFEAPDNIELPVPFLGTIRDLKRIIKENKVDVLVITLSDPYKDRVESLVTDLFRLPVRIYLAPDYVQLALVEAEVEQLVISF